VSRVTRVQGIRYGASLHVVPESPSLLPALRDQGAPPLHLQRVSDHVVDGEPVQHADFAAYEYGDEGLVWELVDCIKWLSRGRSELARHHLTKLVAKFNEQTAGSDGSAENAPPQPNRQRQPGERPWWIAPPGIAERSEHSRGPSRHRTQRQPALRYAMCSTGTAAAGHGNPGPRFALHHRARAGSRHPVVDPAAAGNHGRFPRERNMLHHISIGAQDIERAARFYDAVLAPLGYVRVWADLRPGGDEQAVGYGPTGSGDKLAVKQVSQPIPHMPGFHVAFSAPSRSAVNAFHAAALASGGTDNGPPGLRPDYGPDYFAAFVVDPEGHRLEAVCKAAE
jgi:catechol 2,3-dioxygenase-like lactoylglutathione lyase family enzyme